MKRNLLILVLGCILGLYQPLNAQDAENVVNGHEYVDLALPSGLKWATCNVGAKTPEASGNCYAWGEIKAKDEYNEANSLTYGKEIDDISGNVQYDVAAANWGEGWRMPTLDEMQELMDYCTWEWTKQNGVKGYKVTSVNGNIIFLPTTKYYNGNTLNGGTCGSNNYWSSTPCGDNGYAYKLYFYSKGSTYVEGASRYVGYSVRPVIVDVIEAPFVAAMTEYYTDVTAIIKTYATNGGSEITERGFYWGTNAEPSEADNKVVLENEVGYKTKTLLGLTPNTTYYVKVYATNSEGTSYSEVVSFTTLETPVECEYVDLGLPSGLKWATHNIGATTPEEYGNYYSWGELLPKETYTKANSLTDGKSMDDISGTENDAATVYWGGDWRMPTRAEYIELLSKCTWTWTTQNGVNGYKVTSKTNGNYIFLPAAGWRHGSSLYDAGSGGYYWSSTPLESDANRACSLIFDSDGHYVDYSDRYYARCFRPVSE